MDKRLYVAWNNFTRHQLSCPKRCQWLDVFLYLALKQKEFRFSQFFRGMSSILIEQLLYDMSGMDSSLQLGGDQNMLVTYCLRGRGWLLLHALASSNLKSLTGVSDLVELLIHLSAIDTEEEEPIETADLVDDQNFWPMVDLGTIVTRGDLKSVKKPRVKASTKRSGRWLGSCFSSPVKDSVDGPLTPSSSATEVCCQPDDEEQQMLTDQWNQVQLPTLPAESFSYLILSLLEQLVGHHGDVRCNKTGGAHLFLDQRVMHFALHRLQPPIDCETVDEQRRIFRLVLRSMVSIVLQHRRPLQVEQVIPRLTETALAAVDSSPTDFTDDVIEGLLRFLAAIHPMDDEVLLHQWLNSFHSRHCLALIIDAVESERPAPSVWIPLIGNVMANVSSRSRKSICHHHHHAFGKALTDPDKMDAQSCSISSLFYILLRMYQLGGSSVQKLVLEAIASGGAHPCCCLPPEFIYHMLFERVVPSGEFLAALEVIFRRTGFACQQHPASSSSVTDFQCAFCRYNGGLELERCRQMGVYASTESLSKSSCWNVSLPDPWRAFDFYAEYILTRTDEPFSLSMVKHVQRLIAIATNQVKSEIFARLFYPILTLPPSGSANPSDRSSVLGQMTEACWHMTAILVRQKDICELFLSSNGLELLLDLCRSPEWSWNVARVLESMIDLQCRTVRPGDSADEEFSEIRSTGAAAVSTATPDATALGILEHLLVHHLLYILRSLSPDDPTGTRATDDRCNDPILATELKAATENPVGTIDTVWVHQLNSFQHLDGNLKTASALWETTIRLVVHNRIFSTWFQQHSFVSWIGRILPALCRHLSNPDAHHWNLYADQLELFFTLSLLSNSPSVAPSQLTKSVLEHFQPNCHLATVYDMLLRCSTLERWIQHEEYDYRSGDDDDGTVHLEPLAFERVRKMSRKPTGSSGSGYEADEEVTVPGVSSVPSRGWNQYLFFPVVFHELLTNFSHWLSQSDVENGNIVGSFQDFVPAMTRMASVCSHRLTASVLAGQGLLTTLLSRTMRPMFQHNVSRDIRRQLLWMMRSLGEQRITAGELQLLIDMLKGEEPPWTELLSVLIHLIETSGHRPSHTLSFPVWRIKSEDEEDSIHMSSGSIGSFVQVNDIRSEIFTMTKQAMELGRLHENKGIGSAWKCAAVFLPILTDNNWNMQTDGLTMSTWLFLSESCGLRRRSRRPTTEAFDRPSAHWRPDLQDCTASYPRMAVESNDVGGDLHLFSMGTKSFLVEWWLDPAADNQLLVRLSQSTHSHSQALATQSLDLKVPTERWSHLAVSCRQRASVNGYHRVVHIQVFLNGYQSAAMDLKVPLAPVKRIGNSHSFLLLGTACQQSVASPKSGQQYNRPVMAPPPSWSFGNATVYKGQLLSADMAVLLTALGPDGGIFLASCQDGQTRPNFPRFIHPKWMRPSQDWSRILECSKLMETLQSSLLMTYSAHKPESVFIYPCIISPTAGIFGSIMPSGCVFNAISSDPRSSQQPPIALSVAVAAPVQSQFHPSFHGGLKQLGGYPVLLFLLGQTIEMEADGCQALALNVLFQWLRSDSQEAHLFDVQRGYSMLQHVFHAERCRPGQEMAAVLINLSCSAPVVVVTASGRHSSGHHSDAVVVDPHLLSFAIQCWKHWQRYRDARNGVTTMDVVLAALQHLLRDNHPYRDFNVKQMERAAILPLLLHLARECSLYEECVPLTEKQALMMADLVEGLIGSPPTVAALTTVIEYLLLLHPAEQTYCPTNSTGYPYFFSVSTTRLDPSNNNNTNAAGINLFQPRDWKLPDGYETFAPESSVPPPMNANRLGSALRDVIVKWSDAAKEETDEQPRSASQTMSPAKLVNAKSASTLSINVREEADITLSLHLFRVLIASIRVLPDSMVKQVIGCIIRPDVLVVMARHQRDRMRAGAIRLLQTVLARSQEEEQQFFKQNGLLLLANQLQPYAATTPVVEACVGFCVGVDVILEQVLDPFAIWPENPTPIQLQSTILLLGLLPNAALDPALFHQLATLIRTLATRSNQILKFLLDFGLVETMGKSVVALAHATQSCPGDILEQREDEILLEAIHRILILIATRTVSASGNVPWTVFQDMIQLFHFMERVESGRCGCKARCVRMLHESCCVILKQALQTIQHRVEFNQIGRNHQQHQLFAFQPGTTHFQQVSDKVLNSVLPVSLNRKIKLEKPIGSSEILDRFRFLLTKAVDHISLNVELNPSSIETAFSQDLLTTLVRGVSSILERPKSNGFRYTTSSSDTLTDWSHYYAPDSGDLVRTLFWNSRQVMKAQLNRLVLFLSSPVQDAATLHFVIKTLHDDPHYEDLFKLISPDDSTDFTDSLDANLCHFLHSRKLAENVEHSTLIRIHCISRCLAPSYHRRRCQVLDPAQLKEQLEADRLNWWRMQEEAQSRILSRYDPLIRQVADVAAKWTGLSVESQNSIRHLFLKQLRRDHGSTVMAAGGWIQLVQQWTHQRAAWYFPSSYLRGWRLDSTEGYQRMHLRLERCALNVDAKYLLPRGLPLLEPERLARPLESIVRMSRMDSIDDVVGHADVEKILRTVNCWLVTTTAETLGELVLADRWMTFVSPEFANGGDDNQQVERISHVCYDDVREILPRRFQLQDRALELFVKDNGTRFLVLNSVEERNCIQRELMELCTKLIPSESLVEVTQLWRESQITNFEYLVFLNKLAGRSFNDLMQYPIFPFVLADYESSVLDLDDPHVYRNFKKPMAVQNETRDQHYIENYNYLKRDFENRPEGSGPNFGPFHYGSLYSNPGIVLHFLVRLPPFTKLLMEYQDRNFDVPDRSFHSVGTSWRLASSDSTTDVKELIPEFFYLPEFLVNSLGFDFGMQQSGDPVDDVQLPPWSLGKPRLFIQIHRQALESSWVRDHLHHWIDLIFGFKQTGQAAIDSINVFHPSTYAGFEAGTETSNGDDIERNAKLTMIRSYGQVPRQLFRQPHPMSVQPLNAKTIRRSRSLLPSVNHLQWGCYVGSPSCQDPVLKHKESFAIPVHSFLPLRTGDTYVMGPFTAAILAHSYDKDSFLGRPTGILGVALISWGQSDGIVRIKIRKDEPVKPLFQSQVHDSVVLCATAPDYNRIWVGYRSGMIRVYPFFFDPLKPHFELTGPPTILCGHVGPVQQLVICSAFGLAVSSGSDGSVILWDLHRLTFVRQLTPGLSSDQSEIILPVVHLAVNRDTADIALAVHVDDNQSRLELRSVNGQLVGMTTAHPLITSLCFSSAPEGISINVVAAGLANGRIRLWDTWTLNVVRDITTDSTLPIVSVTYSSTSQHLLAARSDGFLLVWDSPHNHKKSPRYPPFINLTLQ